MNPQEVQTHSCLVSISAPTGAGYRPPVGESPATPRPAATVLLLRRGGKHTPRELEVLMVRRAESQSFMPGVWVFPGGTVVPDEAELLIWIRWITPEVVPVRFDTRFFVALAPPHSPPTPDRREVDDAGWFTPAG